MTGAVQVQKERCGRCGKMAPVTAAFCPRCGVRLRDVSPVLQAEVLDTEPVRAQENWEVLDPPSIPPLRAIPVIPKAPPLPRASAGPMWTGPRPATPPSWSAPRPAAPATKKRPWVWILLGVFVIRGLAAVGTRTTTQSSSPPRYTPSPPVRSSPAYQPYHPPAPPARSHR